MEGVELMATVCDLGDQVLRLARNGNLPAQQAQSLLSDLINCFTNPTAHAKRVLEVARELREYEK